MPNRSDKKPIPAGVQILVAADIVASIIDGDTGLAEAIVAKSETNPVLVLRDSLCEGLSRSTTPTPAGLQALASVLAASR